MDFSAPANVGPSPLTAFSTTRWSLVLDAGGVDGRKHANALEQLCKSYWPPLYAFARRRGYQVQDAEDLTQAFFSDFLQRRAFQRADRTRGRFRTFLLSSFQNFIANTNARNRTVKRGGSMLFFSLDVRETEELYCKEPVDTFSPEKIYDRIWALRLLEQVMGALGHEYQAAKKGELFAALKGSIQGEDESLDYSASSERLNMRVETLKVALHRLRRRFRERVRMEVAETLDNPSEAEAELRHLLFALGS